MVVSAVLMVCACTLAGFFGRLWWAFDLTSNFRVQYLVCLVIAAIVLLLVGKHWPWAVVSALFALANFLDIFPAYVGGRDRTTESSRSVTLLLANVLSSNKQYDEVRRLVRSADPDVIAIIEATDAWMKELSSLDGYPYVVSRPREDNFGIALFSRMHFEQSEIIHIGDARVPTAVARLRSGERGLTVIATHPLPPVGGSRSGRRNRQLEHLASYVQSLKTPVIVLGDLNASPWSPYFKRLLRRTGLCDSRRGRGIQPTWPAHLPWLLRVPIDHVLHSPEITILCRTLGPRIGSDHLPVIVRLSVRQNEKPISPALGRP